MRGQRTWVLLLLAAVFTMHGLQCAAADSVAPSGMHGTPHAITTVGSDPVLHVATPGVAMASADHRTALPLVAAVSATTVGIPLGAGHDSTPQGAGHLWAVCLAVLAAGLAVLLLDLVGRSAATRLPRPRPAIGRAWEWLSRPRPPDLHFLCLMRI